MKNTQPNTDKNFKRKIDYGSSLVPNFWLYLGIIAILSCLSFYGYRYWQLSNLTPQSDAQLNLKPSKSSSQIAPVDSERLTREELSSEDLSIAADLDNIDVILQEMEKNADQQNYIPVKNISKKKARTPTKFTSKIQNNSNVKILTTDINQKTNIPPSLNQTINNSSIQKVIEPSAIKTQIGLRSSERQKIINHNNLIDSNNSNLESSEQSSSSLGRIYNQNQNLRQQDSTTINSEFTAINSRTNNNSNTVNNSPKWRSPSNLESQMTFIAEPSETSGVVNNLEGLPRDLSDYQIKPQDYNYLVPSNYLALPRTNTNSQPTQIPNTRRATRGTSAVSLNNLNSYQLQLQELNQFNLGNNDLNTPNTANLAQPNNSPLTIDRSNYNSSGLQPSGILQPSGSLIIDN